VQDGRGRRNLSDEIGKGRPTHDARDRVGTRKHGLSLGRESLMDARRGSLSRSLVSGSYKTVARPALTVNNYNYIDIIRMEL
jgi:hypothetical protein